MKYFVVDILVFFRLGNLGVIYLFIVMGDIFEIK